MATKKEIFETVSAEVKALCEKHSTPAEFNRDVQKIFDEHLAPKRSGSVVNIDEVTQKDEDGNITHIQCVLSGKFLPATEEFFYVEKQGKGINGLKRLSRQAEAIRKEYEKRLKATENAIMSDVLDGIIEPEKGKQMIEDARQEKPDYSSVTDTLPEQE